MKRGDFVDLSGQIILAYLEEDDTRRVLYRVRPLLNEQGPISLEDLEAFGEEGYLRVAPDRQEQHNFKERMGGLGSLCVIDLRDTQASLGKVRPNKNYQPGRGESNPYIVYSDAVRALPRDLVYEVVTGANSDKALTKLFYLREGGRISGPHCPEGSLSCPDSQVLMPDCERLFLVEMPDHSSRMFYWPLQEDAARLAAVPFGQSTADVSDAAEEEPREESSAAAETALDETAGPQEPVILPEQEEPPAFAGLFSASSALLHSGMTSAGFDLSPREAAHLLMLCLLSGRLQLVGDNLADSRHAAQTLVSLLPEGTAMTDSQAPAEEAAYLQLLYADSGSMRRRVKRYLASPWPVISLRSARGIPDIRKAKDRLDLAALKVRMAQGRPELTLVDETRLAAFFGRLGQEDCALPLQLRAQMADYLAYSAQLSPEDREGALELAFRAFALPYLQARGFGEQETAELLGLERA